MNSFDTFLFGILNFAILTFATLKGTRRLARQFFYARRSNIKRDMVSSAHILRDTKVRLSKAKMAAKGLEDDLRSRMRSAKTGFDAECATVVEEAKKRAGRIVDAAARQGMDDRARALLDIRKQIITKALALAENELKKMPEGSQRKVLNLGLSGMDAFLHSFNAPFEARTGDR